MLTFPRCALVLAGTLIAGASPGTLAAQKNTGAPQCKPAGALAKVAQLPEASGLAVSRRHANRLWAHNDSGEPVAFALDARGAVAGQLRFTGAKVGDWEAMAIGACPAGSCLFLGDIGDNDASRRQITVYRVAEPTDLKAGTAAAEAFHATYPDGAHDAETLLVSADGQLFVVTKGETGPVSLYKFPTALKPGATNRLERVGSSRDKAKVGENDRVTDGSVSADGAWVVLRSKTALTFYPAADFFAGKWSDGHRVDLTSLGEPQGEGVAFGADNAVYVAGEGGGKSQPGTIGRLTCTVPGS